MSFNVHFTNLQVTDFVSKNARNRMKEAIKKKLNKDNMDSFDELKKELIEKYLNDDKVHDLDLTYTLEDDNLKLKLEKTVSEAHKREVLRKKLRDKIRDKRAPATTQRQFLRQQKQENKTLAKDSRVSKEMINAYFRAKVTINKDIPNPIEVLDNKSKYVDEVFQHLLNLSQKCPDKEKLMQVMNNDYINYIQLVCDFDYKKYLDQFFRKVKEMSNSDSNLPDMIRNVPDNTVSAESVDKKVIEQLDDSDSEKEVIDSDDEKDVEKESLCDSENEIIGDVVNKVVDDAISNVD
tara:strand:- start:48 stop:926 length:879 start_codon:yes stop_codon:yes gene_type:complete